MKVFFSLATCLALALMATVSLAAPSLPIDKIQPCPAIGPVPSWTGPNIDPHAEQGQWFQWENQEETVRNYEFYDNVTGSGGGSNSWCAINGYVSSYTQDGNGDITDFVLRATITNDTPETTPWLEGGNSHGETAQIREPYEGTLYDTLLTIEFAISDLSNVPATFAAPYLQGQLPEIIATNEDATAWYCYNEEHPDAGTAGFQAGNYYVPTWDFGDIAPGQSVTEDLEFEVNGVILSDGSDPRYEMILAGDSVDLLLNRTTSLKISEWVENMAVDVGTPYPEIPSTCSVFHAVPEPGTMSLLVMLTAGLILWRRRR